MMKRTSETHPESKSRECRSLTDNEHEVGFQKRKQSEWYRGEISSLFLEAGFFY